MFAGGGIEAAERILKTAGPSDPAILAPGPDSPPPNLAGLSCRWEPLRSAHGRMVALMALATGAEPPETVYAGVLKALSEILDRDIAAHAPASGAALRERFSMRGLAMEARARALKRGWFKAWSWTLLTAAAQKWSHVRGVKIGEYDAPAYVEQLRTQTDFRNTTEPCEWCSTVLKRRSPGSAICWPMNGRRAGWSTESISTGRR